MVSAEVRKALLAAAGALGLALAAGPGAQAAPSLSSFAGSWSGGGTITLDNGKTEKIRCSGSASGGGSSLSQSVRCASTSMRFQISTSLRLQGASVRGSMSESVHGFNASIFGKASGKGFRGSLRGTNAAASGSVSGSPSRQSITLTLASAKVRRVSINLRKN